MTVIIVHGNSCTYDKLLENVIQFLRNKQNTNFWYFSMELHKNSGKSNIELQCKKYQNDFNSIGYVCVIAYSYQTYQLVAQR